VKKNLRLEWCTPEELADNPRNWRKHPQSQEIALKRVLAEVGWAGVVLYNERTGRLIDGHLRKKVAKKTEKMPVLVGSWSEEEEAKILLTLDPLGAMAQADADRLEALLETVHRDGPALDDLLGWIRDKFLPPRPAGDLLDPQVPIEQAAELQAKWQTAPGQLWRIESHQILCGDSTQQADVAQLWAGGGPPLRMVWTDSPYGIDYVRTKNSALKHLHKGTHVKTDIANDALSPRETHELFRRALSLAVGRAKRGASGYAAVPAGPLMVGFIQAFEAAGFSFKHHLVWVKNQFVLGRGDYHYRHEPIIYGWLENGPHYFAADRTQNTVFEFNKPASSEFHATTKPTALIAQMIANSSRPRDLVYDPFCGSGSTLIAAHQLGRVGYGIDISPGCIAITLERLSMLGLKPQRVK
jgi:DNA modification methylase